MRISSSYSTLKLLLVLLFFTIFLPAQVFAKIGVGVGTGKIQLDESLRSGTVYTLPSITVINTGDETQDYELDVTYHEQQPELRPDKAWFTFSPSTFELEPGSVQSVAITLSLPVQPIPGEYFAYIEARPLATARAEGGTTIGIAAASKLYFDIAPATLFQGIFYRVVSLWNHYSPIPQILVGAAVLLVVYTFLSSKVSFSVSVQKKKGRVSHTEDKELDDET